MIPMAVHQCSSFPSRLGRSWQVQPHKNDAYEEVLYGVEGVLTWTVEGRPIEVGPGQALCIPRGAVHRFDNLGSKDVKQLAVISPAIMGPAYFRASRRTNRCRSRRPARPRENDRRISATWPHDTHIQFPTQDVRPFHRRSDCFRVERTQFPGGTFTHSRPAPFHGARSIAIYRRRPFRFDNSASALW